MQQTICLNMIVKDESHVIRRCLASVKPYIDRWVIVDTGSTDNTRDVIKECLQGIPGELFERPWVHFEHNRNEALALAGRSADYVLFIDADETLVVQHGLDKERLVEPCYQVSVVATEFSAMRPLLIRTSHEWRWQGVLHEEIVRLDGPFAPVTLPQVHIEAIQDGGRSKDPERHLKDAETLKQALEREPQNARYASFLAMSYEQAGAWDLALEAHEKRAAMGGWEEEQFYALFRIGAIHHQMKSPPKIVIDALTKAHLFRPSRIEPIYCLALHYYERGESLIALALLNTIMDIPLPEDRTLVDLSVYQYKRALLADLCKKSLVG